MGLTPEARLLALPSVECQLFTDAGGLIQGGKGHFFKNSGENLSAPRRDGCQSVLRCNNTDCEEDFFKITIRIDKSLSNQRAKT
jgi:hypothetical protein